MYETPRGQTSRIKGDGKRSADPAAQDHRMAIIRLLPKFQSPKSYFDPIRWSVVICIRSRRQKVGPSHEETIAMKCNGIKAVCRAHSLLSYHIDQRIHRTQTIRKRRWGCSKRRLCMTFLRNEELCSLYGEGVQIAHSERRSKRISIPNT